jgi:hypothetical protein
MAHIVPSDITRLALSGAHEPELRTLALLKDALPDDYTVFHGVHWSRQYKGTTVYGEIDFVVVNRAGDVLLIEQKNGALEEDDQGLYKRYGEDRKSVAYQILRAVGNLKEKFRHQCGSNPSLIAEYLIYCPDHALKSIKAAAIDIDRVVDAKRASEFPARIRAILPAGKPPVSGHADRVGAFLRQSFELVPDIHAHIGAQEKNFIRLSGGLVDTLDRIEMSPLRLRVFATAGNGKTLVARHFFAKLLAGGRRPLLLCFNRPLAERLKHVAGPGGLVSTWYGFCDQFLQSKGTRLDFDAMKSDREFWSKAVRQLTDAALAGPLTPAWQFDDLIVDEAQDFEPGWMEVLRLFLRDDANILSLEDPNQNVRRMPPALPEGFVGYRSLLNYRSPESIARFIQGALPEFEFTCANDLPGLGAEVVTYTDPAEQPRLVGRVIGRLLSQRFRPQDIVVLSCRGLDSTGFKDVTQVGNHALARFTGEYDLFGNQRYTDGQIVFDTVRRFKGQQAPAVVLVDVDPREQYLQQELQVLFCGMTRATVRLDVVASEAGSWVRAWRLRRNGDSSAVT